jgi:hypothetical protein
MRSAVLGLSQEHVRDDGHADRSTVVVCKIHVPHADRGTDPHETRPSQQPSLCNRTEVVDLQFDGGETSRPGKMSVQGGADGCIGDTRRDASVKRTLAVQQFGTYAALDGQPIAMRSHQFESQQVIEGVPGEEIPNNLGCTFGVAQVW